MIPKNNERILLKGKKLYLTTILFTIFSIYIFTIPTDAGGYHHLLIILVEPILIISSLIKLEKDFDLKYKWLKVIAYIILGTLLCWILFVFVPIINNGILKIIFIIFVFSIVGMIIHQLLKNKF